MLFKAVCWDAACLAALQPAQPAFAQPPPAAPSPLAQRLARQRFFDATPCVLVTGKGMPDLGTRWAAEAEGRAVLCCAVCLPPPLSHACWAAGGAAN